jgi:hypothetical protein
MVQWTAGDEGSCRGWYTDIWRSATMGVDFVTGLMLDHFSNTYYRTVKQYVLRTIQYTWYRIVYVYTYVVRWNLYCSLAQR